MFYCIIFKIIETLILNSNTVNKENLSEPEKLWELSRNGPLVRVPESAGSFRKQRLAIEP